MVHPDSFTWISFAGAAVMGIPFFYIVFVRCIIQGKNPFPWDG